MRNIILTILLVLLPFCAFSHNSVTEISETPSADIQSVKVENIISSPASVGHFSDAYKQTSEWKTYKVLRACGWTSLGVGVTAMGVGTFVGLVVGSIHGPDKNQAAPIIFSSGFGLSLASIPLLVTAYHYRAKAKKIGMELGVTQIPSTSVVSGLAYSPAMSFRVIF